MNKNKLYGFIITLILGVVILGCGQAVTISSSPGSPYNDGYDLRTITPFGNSSFTPAPTDTNSQPPNLPTLPESTMTPTILTPITPTIAFTQPVLSGLAPVLPSYLVFSVLPGGLAMINSEGTDFRWVMEQIPGREYGLIFAPSWSPDGHWIAFLGVRQLPEPDTDIYITNITGSEWRRVTYDSETRASISWSPSGQEIAFTSPELYILNLNTGVTRRIAGIFGITGYPAWSPDGQQIVFQAYTEERESFLYSIDADGTNLNQLGNMQVGNSQFAWSPDGKHLAYRSAEGCGDICILNLDDGSNHCLTNTLGGERDPAWSPDGRHIAFLATQEYLPCLEQRLGEGMVLGWQIYIMNADGTGITQLTNVTYSCFNLGWSPVPALQIDGSYVITASGDRLNLRETPSLRGPLITQLLEGDIVTVLEGPLDVDNYYWWRLRTENGIEGWAVEVYRWYQPVGE
jgi:Tol biopolymer transport system component